MNAFIRYHTVDHLRLLESKLSLWLSHSTPILVYTMAKVGSMSVYSSIKNQTNIPCYHLHTLSIEEETRNRQICFDNGLIPDSRSTLPFVHNKLIKPQKKVKLITLFRNPIERNISAFFDAFELYVGTPISQYNGGIESLIQLYHEKLPHFYAIEWFDQNFKRDSGIDVYNYTFNKEKGFQYIEKDNFNVLILNSALSNSNKEARIANLFNINSFVLKDVNLSAEGSNGELYSEFKNTIKFNKSYLDLLLQSKYTQHFFTKNEIERSYKRWQKI